ncbi:MAG: DUF6265 family protein [Novosphingobium sp.]
MKKLLFAALALAVTPAFAAEPEIPLEPPLPAWMAGTWAMQDGAEWVDEIWTDPRGGMMIGVGRSGFGSELKSWEITRIVADKEGNLRYIARPGGENETVFPKVLESEEAIEFANPAHDYPQRIRYWRQGKLLMAEISKLDGSDAVRFNYRPVIPPQDQR